MIKVVVCIGSACHVKGSRKVVENLQFLIAENKIKDKIDLKGKFCMGRCQEGVCTTVDGEFFSVTPDSTKEFFENHILPKCK